MQRSALEQEKADAIEQEKANARIRRYEGYEVDVETACRKADGLLLALNECEVSLEIPKNIELELQEQKKILLNCKTELNKISTLKADFMFLQRYESTEARFIKSQQTSSKQQPKSVVEEAEKQIKAELILVREKFYATKDKLLISIETLNQAMIVAEKFVTTLSSSFSKKADKISASAAAAEAGSQSESQHLARSLDTTIPVTDPSRALEPEKSHANKTMRQ